MAANDLEFGLNMSAEADAVIVAGVEANYKVTPTWKWEKSTQ